MLSGSDLPEMNIAIFGGSDKAKMIFWQEFLKGKLVKDDMLFPQLQIGPRKEDDYICKKNHSVKYLEEKYIVNTAFVKMTQGPIRFRSLAGREGWDRRPFSLRDKHAIFLVANVTLDDLNTIKEELEWINRELEECKDSRPPITIFYFLSSHNKEKEKELIYEFQEEMDVTLGPTGRIIEYSKKNATERVEENGVDYLCNYFGQKKEKEEKQQKQKEQQAKKLEIIQRGLIAEKEAKIKDPGLIARLSSLFSPNPDRIKYEHLLITERLSAAKQIDDPKKAITELNDIREKIADLRKSAGSTINKILSGEEIHHLDSMFKQIPYIIVIKKLRIQAGKLKNMGNPDIDPVYLEELNEVATDITFLARDQNLKPKSDQDKSPRPF